MVKRTLSNETCTVTLKLSLDPKHDVQAETVPPAQSAQPTQSDQPAQSAQPVASVESVGAPPQSSHNGESPLATRSLAIPLPLPVPGAVATCISIGRSLLRFITVRHRSLFGWSHPIPFLTRPLQP